MVIDTGDSKPLAVRQLHYGLHETPIMQKTIDNLAKLNHIKPDTLSPWAFGITLLPKPHQEDITAGVRNMFGGFASITFTST
eukprot:scaffold36813_cov66-Attheya_sp.AAC.4